MRLSIAAVVVIVPVLLAGCGRVVPPAPAPRPAPARPLPAPLPPPLPTSSDWRDWPLTAGTWSYRQDARGSIALFGTPGADALLTLRCDRTAAAVYLSRAGAASGAFTIRTTTLTQTIPAQPTGTTPYTAAALGRDNRLLDAMGFSRGRFVLEAPPLGPLVVPAWPEILRVVEDCRG